MCVTEKVLKSGMHKNDKWLFRKHTCCRGEGEGEGEGDKIALVLHCGGKNADGK